jgi:hypothetical protein
MREDELAIDEFAIPPEQIIAHDTAKKPKPKKLKGYAPYPYIWIEALKECTSAATFKVALYILQHGVWRLEPRPVSMPGTVAEAIGVSPRAMYRSILELQGYGLIVVGHQPLRAVPKLFPP